MNKNLHQLFSLPPPKLRPDATRHDLQLTRRIFHAACGIAGATVYALFVTHSQAMYIVGMIVSLLYVVEQVRTKYPEISKHISWINGMLLRAEERFKEASAFPYAVGCLLVVLSTPKPIALISIFTVAIADPLAAIVGIQWGRRPLTKDKTMEGSAAFFCATTLIIGSVLMSYTPSWKVFFLAPAAALIVSALELIPLRLDDNLTIPLYTAITVWILCASASLPL